jgi:hypothetical protein
MHFKKRELIDPAVFTTLKSYASIVKSLFVSTFFLLAVPAQAQTILNAYARVTAVTSGNTVLSVSNVNEANHTFNVGEQVIVIQMQDDVIGSNTGNSNTFGNLSSIANAGNYEVRTITAKTPATGTPTSITLNGALTFSYNTGANSSVQVVTFRNLGVNFTTTANITGLAWDGNVGGIIAFQVSNDLILNHSITANSIGFRGGARSVDYGGPVCASGNQNVFISNSANYAAKGEGIYRSTNTGYNFARGRLLNGGGGGADHNGGGGGGGNYTQGGQGGNGYNACTAFPAGGLGGIALSASISSSRLFLGGGGGGGQQNNGVGSSGGNGGGLILIKANRIVTNTTCSSALAITANGGTAGNTGNDGAGGGGGGGSMMFYVNSYSINSACPLTISANGGNGGNVNDGASHAGGGGGGQGAIVFYNSTPSSNVTVNTSNGQPGRDLSSGTITATGGGGTSNSGILTFSTSPLPVSLLYFSAQCANGNGVLLSWSTASEQNNLYFLVQRMSEAGNWETVKQIDGAGNSSSALSYSCTDYNAPDGYKYYRLVQVDNNGTTRILDIATVNCAASNTQILLFPNPASASVSVSSSTNIDEIRITDQTGRLCRRIAGLTDTQFYSVPLDGLQPGMYTVTVVANGQPNNFRLIKAE